MARCISARRLTWPKPGGLFAHRTIPRQGDSRLAVSSRGYDEQGKAIHTGANERVFMTGPSWSGSGRRSRGFTSPVDHHDKLAQRAPLRHQVDDSAVEGCDPPVVCG